MDIDASHLNLCGQTVRNNLKQQDPDNVWVQRGCHKNWRCWGVQKTCIIAIDWHDMCIVIIKSELMEQNQKRGLRISL